jgi:hypothetical protein
MAARLLALVLLALPALALAGGPCTELPGDAPCAQTIERGSPAPHDGWFYTHPGKGRVDEKLSELYGERAGLEVESRHLRSSLLEMEKKPALTWRGAVLLVGVGIVLGASAAIAIAVAAR